VKTKVEIRPLLTFDCEAASVDKRLVSSAAAAGVIHRFGGCKMSSLTVVLQPADCARQSVQFLYAHSPAVDTACAAAAAACRLLSEVVQTFQYNGIPFRDLDIPVIRSCGQSAAPTSKSRPDATDYLLGRYKYSY